MVCSVGSEEEEGDGVDSLPEISFAKEFYSKYEAKEVLGRGVSSIVRRCVEKTSGREFAVKIIELGSDNDEESEQFREQTKREIHILRVCTEHEYIIDLHDSFEGESFIFLVFEICKKGELFDYLTEVVTLSEKRTRLIMRQLLLAVEFIHSRQIVHRDLKPENILLDDNLNVKLSDFGFASVIASDDEVRDLCGTPGYLSPEALKVSMYDDAPGYGRPADMWAVGVIMFTLLSGSPPFWHRRQLIMLRSIMEGQYSLDGPEWCDIGDIAKDLSEGSFLGSANLTLECSLKLLHDWGKMVKQRSMHVYKDSNEIRKLLVVEPSDRLTASQALSHSFFRRDEVKQLEFLPRRKFKGWAYVVIASNRLRVLRSKPRPIDLESVKDNPYALKLFRKYIDAGAFRIYGHWVKRGDHQNRAALFENNIKTDMRTNIGPADAYSDSDSMDVQKAFNWSAAQVPVRERVGLAKPVVGGGARRQSPPTGLMNVPSISVTCDDEPPSSE